MCIILDLHSSKINLILEKNAQDLLGTLVKINQFWGRIPKKLVTFFTRREKIFHCTQFCTLSILSHLENVLIP